MADTTTRLGIPFPEGGDAPDTAADMEAIAQAIDPLMVTYGVGLLAARPGSPVEGSIYIATDVNGGTAYLRSTSAWITLAPGAVTQTFTSGGTLTKLTGATWYEFVVVAGGGGGMGCNVAGTYVAGSDGSPSSIGTVVSAYAGSGCSNFLLYASPGGFLDLGSARISGSGGRGGISAAAAEAGRASTLGAAGGGAGSGAGGGGGGASYGAGGAGGNYTGVATGTAAAAAAANSGGGGGGGICYNTSLYNSGGGGGGGQILVGRLPASAFSSSETVTIGAGGAGGVGNHSSGGAGGSGRVIVTQHFN